MTVRIVSVCVNGKWFAHDLISCGRKPFGFNVVYEVLSLAGKLCDLDDYKLRRFQRSERNDDFDNPVVDVRLRSSLAVALT